MSTTWTSRPSRNWHRLPTDGAERRNNAPSQGDCLRFGIGGHRPLQVLTRLHRGEEGTISILSVFSLLLLTMLLGMVMNVGRQVDGKIRLQNAADSAAYSGGLVIARGLNTLAFSNHLLCDVLAMTAYMREARDRNAESCTPEILDAWNTAAQRLTGSGFPKFVALGQAIQQKVAHEREMVRTFGEWGAASSALVLPLLEQILSDQAIPEYERAVVAAFPDIAQRAAMEIAERNGVPDYGRGTLLGVLWRTNAVPVGGDGEAIESTLPAVDPSLSSNASYIDRARDRRAQIAQDYLDEWNRVTLAAFGYYRPTWQYNTGWMSQFRQLWRNFTCGQLNKLLNEEYPVTNLPFMIRADMMPTEIPVGPCDCEVTDSSHYLEQHFTFVGVAYWRALRVLAPRVFRNPTASDTLAYAQVRVFVPRPRLRWYHVVPGSFSFSIGGVPGDMLPLLNSIDDESSDDSPGSTETSTGYWVVRRQPVPTHWDLFNQHWTCQLVPGKQESMNTLAAILQTTPSISEFSANQIVPPNLGSLDSTDIDRISPH